jgi:hypothetical protein
MAYSDARFDSYGILKSGRGVENFLNRLCFLTPTHTHIFGNHSSGYTCFNTAMCEVQRIAVKRNRNRFGFGLGFGHR